MPKQKVLVKIKPDVLKWIIETSGWDILELEKKIKVHPETITKWISKEQSIEINKLEKIANYLKRPLAVFFLPKPPEQKPLTDFRMIAGSSQKLSIKSMLAIRESRYFQSITKELLVDEKMSLNPKINSKVTIKDDFEKIAKIEREHLGFDSVKGLLSKDAKGGIQNRYNKLREIIESLNIFVFQTNMPIEEIRGFTLSEELPRIIVLNSADSYQARIFSLMHEYAHVLLNEYGICLPEYAKETPNTNQRYRIEMWCNKFAASILAPRDRFVEEFSTIEAKHDEPQKIIDLLSRKFRTSKLVTAYRILELFSKLPSVGEFKKEIIKMQKIKTSVKKRRRYVDPVNLCISGKGRKYISLVLTAQKNNTITYADAIDYLNLKIKHFETLQGRL